jgi:hypothetical protein
MVHPGAVELLTYREFGLSIINIAGASRLMDN